VRSRGSTAASTRTQNSLGDTEKQRQRWRGGKKGDDVNRKEVESRTRFEGPTNEDDEPPSICSARTPSHSCGARMENKDNTEGMTQREREESVCVPLTEACGWRTGR